ncbi:hypothetical protein NQ317_017708 [Molorchus minor]|uniref:Cytochrome P450 n=1 Tax=Molorchus minor TaxID=1323400 RepID=A0ABQ9JHG7_9CUCU|nr:hypothetical protein NQ317_017708 [Molorchus minor]
MECTSTRKMIPLRGTCSFLEDEKWRRLRTKLTPTFTSGKLKMMFETLVACSDGLKDILDDHSTFQDAVDIKDVLSRYTTDIVGSCAFGIDCNSLKNPNSEFRQFGKKFFEQSFTSRIKRIITMIVPRSILIKAGLKLTDPEVQSFFMDVVRKTVDHRENNNVFRKDFMHLLLQLKNRGVVAEDENILESDEDKDKAKTFLTFNEIAAQCFVFFIAGFETSASTMTFALLELAMNQDIQKKLREEITTVLIKHNDQITYDAIMEMVYLDKIICETLRAHPPFPGLPRVCNKDYPVPGTNVVIESGTRVHIPVYGIHTDPDYYPKPEVFDPEGFNEENKSKRPGFTFLPFGEGPRLCIGARFAMMQSKVGLVAIVRHYTVTLNKKTITPIKHDIKTFVMGVKGGVWLNVSRNI